jgi:hypothetical protein
LSKAHRRGPNPVNRNKHRQRPPQGERRNNPPVPLNAEGVPAAVADAPRPSSTVFVTDESRARFPWLPARVIVGSVWRGPANERVRVDDRGAALPL